MPRMSSGKGKILAIVLLVTYIFLVSSMSTALILSAQEEFLKADLFSMMTFFFPLFLVNNVFAVLAAFIYWSLNEQIDLSILLEKRLFKQVNETIEDVEVMNSYYDNVLPWEYTKPSKPVML